MRVSMGPLLQSTSKSCKQRSVQGRVCVKSRNSQSLWAPPIEPAACGRLAAAVGCCAYRQVTLGSWLPDR